MTINPISWANNVRGNLGAHLVTAALGVVAENRLKLVDKGSKAMNYIPGVNIMKQEYSARMKNRQVDNEMKRNLRDLIAKELEKGD